MGEHLLMCYAEPQMNLSNALAKHDIQAFSEALNNPTDAEVYNEMTHLSVFELACQTPGCHEFIEKCVSVGCDVNKLNPELKKRPIHFAVESLSYENINALSSVPTVDLDAKYEDNTPMNLLAKTISDENFNQVFKCIKCLIKRRANLNIPNAREMTPINAIINNRKLSAQYKHAVIDALLENLSEIDLDTYRRGEARRYVEENFPNIRVPSYDASRVQWDFTKMFNALLNERESEFLHGISILCAQNENVDLNKLFQESEGDDTLLIMAAKKNLVAAAERMLRLGADVNLAVRNNMSPIEAACIYGHYRIVDLFLKSPQLNLDTVEPLISIIVRKIGDQTTEKCDYKKCFKLILNNANGSIDQTDRFNCSALHYAVRYSNEEAILELLKRGAYIGTENVFDQIPISDMNAKTLEKHLDNCITTNGLRMGDDNFEIIFDYTNLVPPSTRHHATSKKTGWTDDGTCPDEMAPLERMSKSKELRHLIKHPLITSFLFLKWNRLAFIFYINFFAYAIFSVSMVSYILTCYRNEAPSEALKFLLWIVSATLGFCIFLRELFQLVLSPRIYFRNKENYLEIALIVMIVLILSNVNVNEGTRRTLAAVTILLVVGELFILIGSLPFITFSTHLVMLETVARSFLRSLFLYSIIFLAFSLCFFTLLNENNTPKSNGASDEEDDELNKFNNVGLSIIKTVVMATGEFDAASINFKMNETSYFIFLVFVFLISTVLFNLLNGLAVNDTQVIKSEAELTHYIYRCQLISRYEKILIGNDKNWGCNYLSSFCFRSKISIFKSFIPLYRISILPNSNNVVHIPLPQGNENTLDDAVELEMKNFIGGKSSRKLQCCHFFSCCSHMEQKIVKYSFNVLEKKSHSVDDFDQEIIIKRLNNIEQSMVRLERLVLELNQRRNE